MENDKKIFFSFFHPKFLLIAIFLITLSLVPISYSQAQGSTQISSNTTVSLSVAAKTNVLDITPEMTIDISCYGNKTSSFNLSAAYPGNTGLDVSISKQGDRAAWISFSDYNDISASLLSGETREVSFTINTPNNASEGIYYANITALSQDAQLQRMDLTINFSATEICWGDFKNDLTTNFSLLNETQLGNVSNATIGISNQGLINFFNQTIDFRLVDLDSYVTISDNHIEINSTAIPNLNTSAILTLYDLSFVNPLILRDGVACPASICTEIAYNSSNGTFIFNITSFTTYSASDCGNDVCDSGESYSTCSADCPAPVTPTPTPSGGGGGGGRPIIPIEAPQTYARGAQFVHLPVLKESVVGQVSMIGIGLKNLLKQDTTLKLSVAGIPSDWVSFEPDVLTLDAGQSKGLTLAIVIPTDAKTGDYKVDIIAESNEAYAKDFFVLRARRVSPEYGEPIVTRFVEIDTVKEKTNVELTLKNPPIDNYPIVEIIENIPKELAEHSNEVEFTTAPTEILRQDPIILWSFLNVKPGDSRDILYSVGKQLTDLTHYVYWPLNQINLITQKIPANFKLVGLKIPALYPGQTSLITLKIENLDKDEHKFKFLMELPDGWQLNPEKIEEVVEGEETKEWILSLSVPRGAESGTYIVRAVFGWDSDTIIREYPVIVQFFPSFLIYSVIFLLILVLIAYIVSRITGLRHRPSQIRIRKITRKDVLNKIREQIKEEK